MLTFISDFEALLECCLRRDSRNGIPGSEDVILAPSLCLVLLVASRMREQWRLWNATSRKIPLRPRVGRPWQRSEKICHKYKTSKVEPVLVNLGPHPVDLSLITRWIFCLRITENSFKDSFKENIITTLYMVMLIESSLITNSRNEPPYHPVDVRLISPVSSARGYNVLSVGYLFT